MPLAKSPIIRRPTSGTVARLRKPRTEAKETTPDRDIMQKIRKAVVADKSLSTYGHNVKIISEHGKVTLKGPVRSDDESKNIEAKAVEIAGAGNVTNQLSVAPNK
jgi:osmotically-inducible protein OsmY